MPAYLVAQVDEVRDPSGMQQYAQQASALIGQFGGRYLAASFAPEAMEAHGAPQALAVAEFPGVSEARAFLAAPAYAPLRTLRQRSATVRVLLVDGLPSGPA